jgi:hypothetical protein
MAGYSGTPLPRKLGIKPGHRVLLRGAPAGFALEELPDDVKVVTRAREDLVRELALANRLVDNKVCAIDETWSGLRLVIRLKDR